MNGILGRLGLNLKIDRQRNRIKELEQQVGEMSLRLSEQAVEHAAEILDAEGHVRACAYEMANLEEEVEKFEMKTEQQRLLILALQDELKDIGARQSYQRVEEES